MQPEILNRYLELRRQLFAIEDELETLKNGVATYLKSSGGIFYSDLGVLRARPYSVWKYSPAVDTLQAQIAEAKKQERETGKAQILEEKISLVLSRPHGGIDRVAELPSDAEWDN